MVTTVVAQADTSNNGTGIPKYFSNYWKQYQNGISYASSWSLSSITDQMGNAINLTYVLSDSRSSQNPVNLYLPGGSGASLQYIIKQTTTTPLLANISSNNPNAVNSLSFYWDPSLSHQSCIGSIRGVGKEYEFNYSPVIVSGSTYSRLFLRSYKEYGCNTPVNYTFTYWQESSNGGSNTYTTILADTSALQVDYWRYPAFNSNTTLRPKV